MVQSAPAHGRKPPSLKSAKSFEQNVQTGQNIKKIIKKKSAEKKRERKEIQVDLQFICDQFFQNSFAELEK